MSVMKKDQSETIKAENVSVKEKESRRISDEDLDQVSGGVKMDYMGKAIKLTK